MLLPGPPDLRAAVGVGGLVGAGAAALSWPVPIAPSTWAVGGGGGDFPSIVWGLWRVAKHFPGLPSTHVEDIVFPDGASLLVADLPGAWLLAPVTLIAGAAAATNLLQLAHVALAAACAVLLFRDHGASRGGAAVGAVCFALGGVLLTGLHNGNPDVTPLFTIPLAGFASGRATRSWAWALGAGLLIGMAPWFNPYCGVMAGLCALACAPWAKEGLGRLFTAGGTALALGSAYVALVRTSLDAPDSMVLKSAARPLEAGVAWLDGYVIPGLATTPDPWTRHGWYLGLSALALAGWGLWSLRGEARPWLLLGAVGLVLSLGRAFCWDGQAVVLDGSTIWLPGVWLAELPGYRELQISYRFGALVALATGALAARAPLPGRTTWLAVAVVATDLLIVGQGAAMIAAGPLPLDRSCALLQTLPPGPVLDLPGTHEEEWLLSQTCHGNPVGQGINKPFSKTVRATIDRPAGTALSRLADEGYRYVVLHTTIGDRPDQQEGLARFAETGASLGLVVAEADDVTVLDLERLP